MKVNIIRNENIRIISCVKPGWDEGPSGWDLRAPEGRTGSSTVRMRERKSWRGCLTVTSKQNRTREQKKTTLIVFNSL